MINNAYVKRINVSDNISYSTHVDLLNSLFGTSLPKDGHQQATWKLSGYSNWCCWFPNFIKDKNGTPKPNSSGWINTITRNENTIEEYDAEQNVEEYDLYGKSQDGYDSSFMRLVFGKDSKSDKYVFKGIYSFSPSETKDYLHVFKRISKTVDLIGWPVYDIKVRDIDRSEIKELYKFVKPVNVKTGDIFNSWNLTNNVATNNTKKETYLNGQIKLHKEAAWFFETGTIYPMGTTISVTYAGISYSCTICSSTNSNYKIMLDNSLLQKLNEDIEKLDYYPIMQFHRQGDRLYSLFLMRSGEDKYIKPLDDTYTYEEKEKHANTIDLNSLKHIAKIHSSKQTKIVETSIKQYTRDAYIATFAKKKSKGICQLCGEKAPFKDKNGFPYLESHHIIWLSKGGSDSIDNVVALCPNCHRKMHILDNKADVELLQLIASENL